MSKKTIGGQKDRRSKKIQRNTSKSGIKCVCLDARSIINKKTELNIMVDDIKPHIIGITESLANNDITDAELGLEGYVMFRKDRMGRRGGGVLLYIKETIPSRRSRIFLRRRPLSCVSCQVDAIQWGGGVVAECFHGLQKPARFTGGGVVPWIFRLWGPFTFLGFPKGGARALQAPPELQE